MRDYGKVVFLVVVALLTSLGLQAQWKTRWDYEGAKGPDHWSELDPEYASCNAGMTLLPYGCPSARISAEIPGLVAQVADHREQHPDPLWRRPR